MSRPLFLFGPFNSTVAFLLATHVFVHIGIVIEGTD